jgi:hypothetical protein
MNTIQKILLFFVLPIIAPILITPRILSMGFMYVLIFLLNPIYFVIIGFLLLRGRSGALTLSIFLLGLNAIMRILMFYPNATFIDGTIDIFYIVTSILSIALSVYLVLRLDQVDVRSQMVK